MADSSLLKARGLAQGLEVLTWLSVEWGVADCDGTCAGDGLHGLAILPEAKLID